MICTAKVVLFRLLDEAELPIETFARLHELSKKAKPGWVIAAWELIGYPGVIVFMKRQGRTCE